MNWQAISFDWAHARAFLAAADEGSLSAAARALNTTQPTIGRQIAALERELDVVLFERTGRSITLTPSGRDLAEHVRDMAEAAMRLSLTASGQSQTIEGQVRITASDVFSAIILPRALVELAEIAPRLQIELVAANEISDLLHREADIAIRHVRPDQPELIARKVRDATGRFYAASGYLDRRGRPDTLADLRAHDFIGMSDNPRLLDHLLPLGVPITLDNFRYGSANGIVAWELARAGLGIAIMSDDVARPTPGMEVVLPEMDPLTFPVWLTTHRELHSSRRIRLVFDFLATHLASQWPAEPLASR